MIITCILAIVEWILAAFGLMLLWLAYAYQIPGLLLPVGILSMLATSIRGLAFLRSNGAAVERVFTAQDEPHPTAEQSEDRP